MKIRAMISTLVMALSLPMVSAIAADEAGVEPLLGGYDAIRVALVEDELEKSQAAGAALQALATRWLADHPEHALRAEIAKVEKGSGELATAESLDDARVAFVTLSQGTIAAIRADEALKAKWQLFFCPMVARKLGYWVQPKGQELANPFMGGSMPGCGTKKPW